MKFKRKDTSDGRWDGTFQGLYTNMEARLFFIIIGMLIGMSLLAGCGKGGSFSFVEEFLLDDGTHCVRYERGGITCDWGEVR